MLHVHTNASSENSPVPQNRSRPAIVLASIASASSSASLVAFFSPSAKHDSARGSELPRLPALDINATILIEPSNYELHRHIVQSPRLRIKPVNHPLATSSTGCLSSFLRLLHLSNKPSRNAVAPSTEEYAFRIASSP